MPRSPGTECLLPGSELVDRDCGSWWKAKQKFHLIDWLSMLFLHLFITRKVDFNVHEVKERKKIDISLARPEEIIPLNSIHCVNLKMLCCTKQNWYQRFFLRFLSN